MKKETQPQHTQGEWKVNGEFIYTGKEERIVARCELNCGTYNNPMKREEAEANAQRIVKAVNMHDELVKQLQEMIRYSKVLAKNSHATRHLPIQEAERLLKQAEG